MKKFLLSIFCSLMAIISVQAQSEPCYTLDPVKGSNSAYANSCDITIDGITWNLNGNSTMIPWRIGGKSLTNVDRTLYSKTPMSAAVDKVVLHVGGMSSITVNSAKLLVANSADFSDAVETAFTMKANTQSEIAVSAAVGAYYKFVFNVTVSGSSNKFIEVKKVEFYAAEVAETEVATPTFSVEGGTYYNPFSVEIAAEEGATVYYTLDGTEPTAESAEYTEAIAFNAFGTKTTLKAAACIEGEWSNVAIANYSLEVAAPVFSVKGGVYEKLSGETALQFTCETESATIYYNNRGGDPKTEGSKSYGTLSVLSTAEVKAVAFVEVDGEKLYSDVVSEKYYISPVKPYEKATEFVAGEYLIHANGFAATALSESGNYGYLPQFAVAANGNFIETNAFYAFKFTEVEGGYTIQDTFGRYVYQTGTYNSFNVAAEMPAEGAVWTVAIDETTGEATITNTSVNKYIQYAASYTSYGSYADVKGVKPSLYKLGEYPTMTVTPANWETIPAFEKVTITCESGIAYNETDENYPYYTIGWDNTPFEFDNVVVVGENTIELTFNKPIEDNGDYRVVLPAGLFTLDPDGLAIPSAKVQNTITVENLNVLEVAYANPDNGSTVKSIEYLYFEFNQNIVDNVSDAVITNENGDEFPLTVTYTDGWGEQCPYTALCLKAAEPITAPGVYTFVLKKQYVCAEANAAVTIADDLTYTFTIVESLKVTNITPANGAEVEVIEDILIEFNKEITCWAEAFYMTSDSGAEYYLTPSFNDKDGNELPYNSIRLVAETPITVAGTYTLYIEDYNIATTDWMNQEILPAQTFTFIIPGEGGEGEGEGEVDYTPAYNGTRTNTGRTIKGITVTTATNWGTYDLTATEQTQDYTDATAVAVFTVAPGEDVQVSFNKVGEWIHQYIFVDFDADGFTASIAEGSDWEPAGDLVAYSFYNNDGSSDEYGWNSVGTVITGNNRNTPSMPSFKAPEAVGEYRMRIKQDWSNIDPMGDSDGKFGDFKANGGQIIDVILSVTVPEGIENVVTEAAAETIYDLTGRKIETITKAGIYIVNGKKVLVK